MLIDNFVQLKSGLLSNSIVCAIFQILQALLLQLLKIWTFSGDILAEPYHVKMAIQILTNSYMYL